MSHRDEDREGHTIVAITLYWVMALGIVALAVLGLTMVHGSIALERKFTLYQLRKSIGITVLLPALLRLAWRYGRILPSLPAHMPRREQLVDRLARSEES